MPRISETLKKQVKANAVKFGHKIGKFSNDKGTDIHRALCSDCGGHVVVNVEHKPQIYGGLVDTWCSAEAREAAEQSAAVYDVSKTVIGDSDAKAQKEEWQKAVERQKRRRRAKEAPDAHDGEPASVEVKEAFEELAHIDEGSMETAELKTIAIGIDEAKDKDTGFTSVAVMTDDQLVNVLCDRDRASKTFGDMSAADASDRVARYVKRLKSEPEPFYRVGDVGTLPGDVAVTVRRIDQFASIGIDENGKEIAFYHGEFNPLPPVSGRMAGGGEPNLPKSLKLDVEPEPGTFDATTGTFTPKRATVLLNRGREVKRNHRRNDRKKLAKKLRQMNQQKAKQQR